MSDPQTIVRDLTVPLAGDQGLDVVAVEVKGQGGRRLVRVTVDRRGGVDLATCQRLSEQLSARLDSVDPVPGGYRLEVTSPGTDRALTGQEDFDRVAGRDVLVHYRIDDGRVLQARGSVTEARPDAVLLDVDGGSVAIGYDTIVTARQSLPW